MEAAWILAVSMREGRSLESAESAGAAVLHVALAARKVGPLAPDWRARFDAEPIRTDMLEALRLDARDLLDAARWPDVARAVTENGGNPRWARHVPFLMVSTLRRRLARRVEVSIPVIEALEDASRCGPGLLRAGAWFGLPVDQRVDVAGDFDALRVHLELTQRLLDLRARHDADPAHRWPEDLGDDGSSSCPGVRFVLRREAPNLLVLEAESAEGAWWEGSEGSTGYPARVEIPVDDP